MTDKGIVWSIFFVAAAIVLIVWVITRNLGASRQAKAALTTDKQYRGLADEYRRLSDLAVTAQEHTDLRLTDLSVQMDELRNQMNKLQHILNEVE
jgi:predicted RND superfamily exporter protein